VDRPSLAQLRQVDNRIEGRSRERSSQSLADFYKKFYQPDNAVLVVTRRLDDSKTLHIVGESMGKLPKPSRVLD
jgi:predicted Zn-dependent peptidase